MEKYLKFVHKLSEKEIVEVKQLEKINKDDRNVYYKLCPQSLDGTDESVYHILFEEQGRLTAYMSLSTYDIDEMEITPIFNGDKDKFLKMYQLAIDKAKQFKAKKILVIVDENDSSMIGILNDLGLNYTFCEYRMVFDGREYHPAVESIDNELSIKDASSENIKQVTYLDQNGFRCSGESSDEDMGDVNLTDIKLAFWKNNIIGKIKVEEKDGVFAIYGFVIDPNYRRRGFGKKFLKIIINSILKTDYKELYLEVVSENIAAYTLYISLGFNKQSTFNYYEYELKNE